jgi:LPXTG-motif cell wall-anchored protein
VAPGGATVLINGQEVAARVITPATSSAGQKDPEDRSPEEVLELQNAASALVNELNSLSGGDSGLSVENTPTGAVIKGLLDVPVPVEHTVRVKARGKSALFAAVNADGSTTKVSEGAVIRLSGNGRVGVTAVNLEPGEIIEFVLMSTPTLLERLEVGADGSINFQADIPSSIGVGDHTLVLATPSLMASLGLQIAAPAESLPPTGNDSNDLATVLMLLAMGVGLVLASRRRINRV